MNMTDSDTSIDFCQVRCVHPKAVALARASLPDYQSTENASVFLKYMADPTRFRILSALSIAELCVCDISAVIGISESAVSHQLKMLRTGRLVGFRKEGRVVYYRLLDGHVASMIRSATEHASEEV